MVKAVAAVRVVPALARASLFILAWLAPVGAAAPAAEPCQGKSGQAPPRVRVDFRAGVDIRKFAQFSGRSVTPLTADPTKSSTRMKDVRWQAYVDALDQLALLQGIAYTRARQRYRDAFGALVNTGDQTVLRRDIRPLLEREHEDYDKCVYVYEVVVGARLETRLDNLEEPFGASVTDYMRRFEERDGKVSINLADVFDHLWNDARFTNEVQKTWKDERKREPFLYKDDDTQMFLEMVDARSFEISNYDKGQYRPSAVLAAIIRRAVRPKVQEFLARYRRVDVTCTGSTDRLPIRRGLPYEGDGRYATPGTSAKGDLDLASRDGRPLAPSLTDNMRLSFARAYEALAILGAGMTRPERLSLRYVGRGETDASKRDDPFSRKIVFEIEGHDRYK